METPVKKPWLAEYPSGVPATLDVTVYRSLVELLDEAFRRHADRHAAVFMGRALRFRELDELSATFGAWLQGLGLARGARVALMMPNLPQYMVAIAAVLRAGCVVVNVNPLYTPRELEHQLVDSGAEAVVILENFATTLAQVIERTPVRHVVLASMGDMLGFVKGLVVNTVVRHVHRMVPAYELPRDGGRTVTRFNMALADGTRMRLAPAATGPDDVAFLQYTGGTTGASKGATLLHRNVVANILQNEAWFRPVLERAGGEPLVVVCALPLYHIYALAVCFLMGARFGSTNLLIANPRDLPALVKTLRQHRVHMFPAVDTLFAALLNQPDFARLDFSRMLVAPSGGMACRQATAERWLELTGCPMVEGYGMSELSPVATSNRLDRPEFTGTVGLPLPSTEVVIRDDAGRDLPCGEAGEICVRGPQVMAGYWMRPDETAQVMGPDGFLKTGDIGVMDARGFVRIVDRKKDMILVSGFNVYPTEIEQVASLHPGVLECAAVGVPDEKSGEAVRLVVVRKDPALSAEQLIEHCRQHLTGYKRPREVAFRDELPKSNVGKILRRALRPPG